MPQSDSLEDTSLPLLRSLFWGSKARDGLADMHPSVRAAREDHTKSTLLISDVTRNPSLAQHFGEYGLSDFFDHRGQRIFQNLSMSVAAKQYMETGKSFGSTPIRDPKTAAGPGRQLPSARAYRLATETLQKDREAMRSRNAGLYQTLTDGVKVQWDEVQLRQRDMLFYEVPTSDLTLPPGILLNDVLPVVGTRLQEREERRTFEKLNHDLIEGNFQTMHAVKLQNWIFHEYDDVREIVDWVQTWVGSTGLITQLGMDRAAYCKFVMDVGLVDQDTVPFVWAVSIFDGRAKKLRITPIDPDWMDPHLEGRTPTMALVSKWDMICLLDAIVRRRFGGHAAGVRAFMERLRVVGQVLEAEFIRRDREEGENNEADANGQAARRYSAGHPGRMRPLTLAAAHHKEGEGARGGPTASEGTGDKKRRSKEVAVPAAVTMAPQPSTEATRRGSVFDSSLWKRHRRLSGMMIEPEVLQLVEQHREVFEKLFRCYAHVEKDTGGGGNEKLEIDFAGFLQFCQDFSIVPRLASRHEVLQAFRASECAEVVVVQRQLPEPPRQPSPQPQTAPPVPTMFVSEGATSRPERLQPPPSRTGARTGRAGSKGRPSTLTLHGQSEGDGAAHTNQEQAHKKARPPKQQTRLVYGASAFVESLIRIAFGYLLTYGNTIQVSSSSRAKMVWLVVYLHQMLLSMQGSQGRRSRGELSTRPSTAATAAAATRPSTGATAPTTRPPTEEGGTRGSFVRMDPGLRVPRPSVSSTADTRPWSIESSRAGEASLRSASSSVPTSAGWPSAPPTAGGMSRRLVLALEQLQAADFQSVPLPPMQRPASPERLSVMTLNEQNLKSYSGQDGDDLRSESPTHRSESSRASGSKGSKTKYRNKKSRASICRSMSKVAELEDKVDTHSQTLTPLPSDAFKAEELLLRTMLRTSAAVAEGWESVAHLFDPAAQARSTSRAPSIDDVRQRSPSKKEPPKGMRHSYPSSARGAQHAEPIGDREALLWQLHRDEPSIDRSDMTPPPLNPLACTVQEKLDRFAPLPTPKGPPRNSAESRGSSAAA